MAAADDRPETGRGRTRWGVALPILALPVLVLGFLIIGLFTWALSDEDDPRAGGPAKVSCAEALGFGGAQRPANARPDRCTMQHGIDIAYTAVLRMPREDVRGWLRETYPHAPEIRTGDPCGALCLDVTHEDGLPASAEAHVVQVRVEYVNAETALVRFSAFTM
ncbi:MULTISPECIES: hypothetical protein [Streptomyces]|uniref:hypothetical protein n=1 Tax=Streptomyces TaxID=1883 RepID=UPI002034BA9D|nr:MULTISPECIES: hypothetical protein [Streptomyces]UUA07169.1 hypothetical protein NNW98_17190 [Streptomyces koelreuteriae]UUA14798.1 hypothetical protein NNW99_17185 [Streptomyces sp. CRCS-T-1]